ncbi:MAG TPA: YqhA family protein [Fimbriimonadaceae bacterium]|nr:YqhA family protein [Fimbriimonadaceae bacterium]HRJ96757.1 YqhA family protein [Fimbriimonadaceae bacterium]
MRRFLHATRFAVVLAVIGIIACSICTYVYATISVGHLIWETFGSPEFDHKGATYLAAQATEFIDLYLLGTVLYIIALGLYQLFIDESLPMPKWLRFHSLDDLKYKLIGIVIVLLGVSFLGEVVEWNGGTAILYLAAAIAAVNLAFAPILWMNKRHAAADPTIEGEHG